MSADITQAADGGMVERLRGIVRGDSYADGVMDAYGSLPKGQFWDDLEAATARIERLTAALTHCQGALAVLVDPDAIKKTTVWNAWTLAMAAEADARTTLGKPS